MKRVIVFGATGNLGAYIALHLKSEGYDVIAVGGRKDDRGFFAERGMKYYSVDIRKPTAFDTLPTESVDAVCHFAGALPSRYAFVPVELFESIISPQTPSDMARYHNNGSVIPDEAPRHFPLTGDHAVYTIAKNAAVDLMEHYRAEYGIAFFALRFFTIYQYHPNAWHYCNFKHRMMPFRMLMERASKSLPVEIWGDCKKAKEMVYIKDFVRLVRNCVDSDLPGGCYNVGNGWQITLEEQIKGIVKVFSPEDNPSPIIYRPEKPDPLENAFSMEKTFRDLRWKPVYSYLDQLRDFKHEMETEPMAGLWGKRGFRTGIRKG